jgi:hypothetical protein
MSGVRVTPRVIDRSAPRVRLLSEKFKPGAVIAVLGLMFAVGMAFALFNEDPGYRVIMGSAGLVALLALFALLMLHISMKERGVRIDPRFAGLRFVAHSTTNALFTAAGLVGLVPGLVVAAELSSGITRRGAIAFIALSLVFVVFLVQQVTSLRTPAGLALTPDRIRGVRGSKSVDLPWDDLARAEVIFANGAQLVLHLRSGAAIKIDPRYTGSDPNALAPIIGFFIDHPEFRDRLLAPDAAIALVETAVAAPSDGS